MVKKGITRLTGKDMKDSFNLLFTSQDVVGIKVNPVGAPLISTRLEVVDAVIKWLVDNGLPKRNIVIWDRFDYMLKDAGFTPDRYPGVCIEGLQTMDPEGNKWRDEKGNHISVENFDKDVYYYAKGVVGKKVRGYKDDVFYLNQHVFNGEYSYFGKLLTRKLTKIINVPVFKNTKGERFKKISKTFPRTIAQLGFNKGITDRRQKVSFHTLRHSFASWLVQSGIPLLTVQKLLGHSTIRMTERYSHLAPENFSQAADVLSSMASDGPVAEKVVNIKK